MKLEAWAVGITAGSREVPGRKGLWQEKSISYNNNNNNNNNNYYYYYYYYIIKYAIRTARKTLINVRRSVVNSVTGGDVRTFVPLAKYHLSHTVYWMLIAPVIRSVRWIYQFIIGWSVSAHCSLFSARCLISIRYISRQRSIMQTLDTWHKMLNKKWYLSPINFTNKHE